MACCVSARPVSRFQCKLAVQHSSGYVSAQAAPVTEKSNGVAAGAVQAVQEEATPSHDVYGHLPKPEENDKASGQWQCCMQHVMQS